MSSRVSAASNPYVSVTCVTRRYQVSAARVKAMAGVVCSRLGVADHELAIRFVGSASIRRLNREFRRIDRATDVLSFPQVDWPEPVALRPARAPAKAVARRPRAGDLPPVTDVLGDLVISLPDAAANAARIGQPLSRELGFLLVHGLLHLCGYDHLTSADEHQMRKAQRVLMRLLAGPAGGKPLWHGSVKAQRKRRTNAN